VNYIGLPGRPGLAGLDDVVLDFDVRVSRIEVAHESLEITPVNEPV